MASGVKVNPEIDSTFKEIKLDKTLKYVVYMINDDSTEIVLDKKCEQATYEEFVDALPRDQPRYAIFDYHFTVNDGLRTKLLFIFWAPDSCGIKKKMIYASSKEALKKHFTGVVEIQANDMEEIAEENVQEKVKSTK